MEQTGFSPGDEMSPENVTSSGSYQTPEPQGKFVRTDAGAIGTQPMVTQPRRVPVACAVASGTAPTARDPDERSVANSSPKAPSRSSVTSSNMLDRQLELVRAREIARKHRQVLEAERKELELDAEIAALSSHRSNASGVSSVNKRNAGASSQTHAFEELTEDNLFDHTRKLREGPVLEEYEPTSPEQEEFMPLPVDFDHDAAEQAMRDMIRQHEVQRQALQAQVSQEASLTIDEKPCEGPLLQMFNDATFDCNRSSAACIISYPQAPIPSPVQVFQNNMLVQGDLIARQQQMNVANVEQNVINMAESR